jgi:hypothetical protein
MKLEPIDLILERRQSAKAVQDWSQRRSSGRPYFAQTSAVAAPPEALDEVFAGLSATSQCAAAFSPKSALDAVPLAALAANLERQHERLASFLRELETGSPS